MSATGGELVFASAKALARMIRQKQVSAVEVIEAHLARIAEVNPTINAVVYLDGERALNAARAADAALARGALTGPLHGVPFTVKDNIRVAGMVCTTGTLGYQGWVAPDDAVMVARLRKAGAIPLAMTNMPELGIAFETDNLVYGRTNNPYDLSRTSGGSSGGESAIIAAGGSPFGLGNDGAGSVRTPAHCCGLAGLKPNAGRLPVTGHITTSYGGFYPGVSQDGPLARYVEDLNLVMPIIAGVDWRDPAIIPMPVRNADDVALRGLRVAYYTDDGFTAPTPETVETVRRAARMLADAGAILEEARPDIVAEALDIRRQFYGAVSAASLDDALRTMGTTETSRLMAEFKAMTAPYVEMSKGDLLKLTGRLGAFRSAMLSFMEHYDAILCPTAATPALPHGQSFSHYHVFSYTMPFNLTGYPAVSVRAGTSPEGLPIGVQLAARPFREDVALALAGAIERAGGGYQRPPL
jgi:amidase